MCDSGAVVEDDDRVGILRESPHGQQAVVGVDDDVARVGGIWEDGIRLYDLLGKPVVEPFEQKRAETGPGTASDGVKQHEALSQEQGVSGKVRRGNLSKSQSHTAAATTYFQRVTAICFSVDHLHDFLVDRLSGLISIAPVVSGADAILANVEVFGIIYVLVGARLDAVDDLIFFPLLFSLFLPFTSDPGAACVSREVPSRSISPWVCIECRRFDSRRHLSVAALGGEIFEISVLADAMLLAQPAARTGCQLDTDSQQGRKGGDGGVVGIGVALTAVSALAGLNSNDFSKARRRNVLDSNTRDGKSTCTQYLGIAWASKIAKERSKVAEFLSKVENETRRR